MDLDEAVPQFTVLSNAQLQMITLGTYQLKQAKSYTREHLSEEGKYKIDVHNLAPGLLRLLQSDTSVGLSIQMKKSVNR